MSETQYAATHGMYLIILKQVRYEIGCKQQNGLPSSVLGNGVGLGSPTIKRFYEGRHQTAVWDRKVKDRGHYYHERGYISKHAGLSELELE